MLFNLSIGRSAALAIALTSSIASAFPDPNYTGPESVQGFKNLYPYQHPPANHRPKIYIRSSDNDTDDISADFYRGLLKANHGGTLVLPKNKTFVIGKKLDLTFLKDVHVNLEGTILFTDNITYWQSDYFYHLFQNSIAFWKWGGEDIKIYGEGILDGNGQAWYDGFAGMEILDPDNTYYRPILFYAENATNLYIEGIQFQGSPCWTNFIVTSKNVVYDRVIIENLSTSENPPKNTDGWDSYNVDGLTVRDAWINIGDDCFSPKPNTSNILVENIYCNGTHGVSMGSIGQYSGVKDHIYNVHIENITMLNGEYGARLKSWAGQNVGYGFIDNVTFKNVYNYNNDVPIMLDACYFEVNSTMCSQYPSRVDMTNIRFSNFTGSSSGINGPVIANLVCSPNAICTNITLEDINLTHPNGSSPVIICEGIAGGVGVPCVSDGSIPAVLDLD
ncbi:uncharacterized protein L3040_007947 [Drepanopeziza brunnea f. sp. 'multigermtubi']|uniref:galacturonan 1,4-alpha-galacturonidase n=1 Tax=Marssonina brunnea f. sp. multigermtubi (strain MB_m1) TaxID=1072389 RepID=K1XNI5_MARBU|nr:putative exopolygalacturonase B [Drepanopeziza brunnea f. sp. 'multigermtubi' MB_m1]EKD14049.1 putative exopolygalacturonase B [Drepanopeziza brunnea f. sp. 'multigermtubi' MB_m1]KAJ5035480.1 hypothetical protein L3040_007947 [Drepanopeziza brunnea f. sp. 'multigermtubi']